MIDLKDNLKLKEIRDIPRAIDEYHYSDSFGWQWEKFAKTQIDDTDHDNSKIRFFNEIGEDASFFDNKTVLEVGSGAGRFTDILLKYTNAIVYSVDSSNAVEVNRSNNKEFYKKRLFIYQASIYDLPFRKQQFDIVICFGVIQHTPNVKKTINHLCENLKENGKLFLDFYPYKGFWTYIHAKYILRPITKRLSKRKLFFVIDRYLDFFIKVSKILIKFKLSIFTRFLPIADIKNAVPHIKNKNRFREIVLLDTFDMLSPQYDKPQRFKTLCKYISSNGLTINFSGMIKYDNFSSAVIRGSKD